MGTVHGFDLQTEGMGSHVTSFSPKNNARGARGPVDGIRSKGNFGNTKQASNSRAKTSPITSENALPQAPLITLLQKQTPPSNFLFSSKSSDQASTALDQPKRTEFGGPSSQSHQTRTTPATKIQARANGNKAKAGMGNPPKRENHGSFSISNGTSKSKPNHDLGMVRLGRNEGMASHLSLNTGEQKAGVPTTVGPGLVGMGKPLVDFPLRQTVGSRSKNIQLESPIAAFAGATLERIGSGGKRRGKENMDTQNNGSEVLGKRSIKGLGLDRPINVEVQSDAMLEGEESGDFRACSDLRERGRLAQEVAEGSGMEFIEHCEGSNPA